MARAKGQKSRGKKSHFKANAPFFKFLATLSPKRQKALIKGADKEILYALSEIALNIMRRRVSFSESEKKKLRPFEKQFYELSKKKHNLKKRKVIVQKGGFLGTLLGTVLPVIISSVLAATGK